VQQPYCPRLCADDVDELATETTSDEQLNSVSETRQDQYAGTRERLPCVLGRIRLIDT
jgi:hypothetical protein